MSGRLGAHGEHQFPAQLKPFCCLYDFMVVVLVDKSTLLNTYICTYDQDTLCFVFIFSCVYFRAQLVPWRGEWSRPDLFHPSCQ